MRFICMNLRRSSNGMGSRMLRVWNESHLSLEREPLALKDQVSKLLGLLFAVTTEIRHYPTCIKEAIMQVIVTYQSLDDFRQTSPGELHDFPSVLSGDRHKGFGLAAVRGLRPAFPPLFRKKVHQFPEINRRRMLGCLPGSRKLRQVWLPRPLFC